MNLSIKDDCELCGGKIPAEEKLIVNTVHGTDIHIKPTICYTCVLSILHQEKRCSLFANKEQLNVIKGKE
jgi:hypothetical protein